jgi:hypothetical protein
MCDIFQLVYHTIEPGERGGKVYVCSAIDASSLLFFYLPCVSYLHWVKRVAFLLLLLFVCLHPAMAQDDLFGPAPKKAEVRTGWLLSANADLDIPGGNLAREFGASYRIGPSVLYKTKSNWLFGAKGDFISGNTVRLDSLLWNVRDRYGEFLNQSGQRITISTFERGYDIMLQAGKIINVSKKNPDDGIMLLTGVGFMQHKILIDDKGNSVPQVDGNYRKGYDRLTNGPALEEYVAFTHFARKGLIHYHIGLDALFGFTQDRRGYLFDVMHTDNQQRVDILFGIRGGWYIPIFKRKSEDIPFQ